MPGGAAARVKQATIDRKARLLEIEIGQMFAHPLAVQQDRIVALIDHGIAAPHKGIALAVGMKQVYQPALAVHHVIVQLGFQLFPQLQAVGIEFAVARQKVIRPHNRGVAPDVAGAKVAFLQHRDVAQAVVLGEVIGGGKPMPATTDDDGVIARLRLGVAPDRAPAAVAQKPLWDDPQT